MIRIYEGYFNNIDNDVDTDDVQMTGSFGPEDNEHLFKYEISTIWGLPTKDDEKLKTQIEKNLTNKTLGLVNSLCNVFEISPIINDYRLFIYENDKPTVCSYKEFCEFLDTYIKKSIEDSILFKNEHPEEFSNKVFQYQFPEFSIGVVFDTSLSYKKAYKEFSIVINRLNNILHNYIFAKMFIDNYQLICMWGELSVIDDVFNELFSHISNQNEDVSDMLNLQYVEPPRVTATFLKKAKPYKSYLCIDKSEKIVLTQKLDKEKIKEPIGICVNTGVDSNDKSYATFIPFRYCAVDRPDAGAVTGRHIIFCNLWYDNYEEVLGADGVQNTKRLYDMANRIAKESGSFDSHWNKHSINNVKKLGYFPVLTSVYRFHTHGTQRGNWYLGSPEEVSKIFKLEIDKKYKDKLWSDQYDFGIRNSFSVSGYVGYATSTLFQENKDVNLLYIKITSVRDEIEIDNQLAYNYFDVIPMLRLTER